MEQVLKPNLTASEPLFQLLFHHHPLPMWIYDLETLAFLEVNAAAVEKYGYSQTEFLGMTLRDIRPTEDIPRLLADVAQARPSLQHSGRWRHRHKNGVIIDVEITSHALEFNGRKAALVMAQDITAHKRAQERLRQAVRAANVGLWDWDLRANQVYYSSEWKRQIGYEAHEISNDFSEWECRVHPDDLKHAKAMVQAYLEKPWPNYANEFRFRHKDGSYRWILAQASLQLDEHGHPQRMLGSHIDITERKRAEEALRFSQEQLLSMIEQAPISIAMFDRDMRYLVTSRRWAAEYGRGYHDLIGRHHYEVHPDLPDWWKAVHQRGLAGETLSNDDDLWIQADGSKNWLHWSVLPWRNARGEIGGIIISAEDITESKRTEEQLRLQSAALEATANAIVITDREGTIQWVNPAFTQLTGYTLAEACGKNPRDLIKSDRQDWAIYKELWTTILSGNSWQGELINRRKDGSLYIEEQTITPLRNKSNEITHFIAIKQDITARKQLEAENEQLAAQFYQSQKMESIGQLAGGIAHDFNNMLVPIVGYAELGQMNLPEESKLWTDLDRIKDAANRAASLTRQILAFSRHQMLEMKMLDLNQVISEFEPMLRRLIGENIALESHLGANLALIKADKGQLEQVLLNLVVNARDAMPNGGRLMIETATVMLDKAYIARHLGAQPGPHALLAVSDTGHGMDAATQLRIFDPFFTTKAQGQGTGLGLATVFGIVKQHHGNIWVYSEPGQGSTFKIYLPLAQAMVSPAQTQTPQAGSLDGTETVLVAEDEASVRQLVSDTLRAHGYQVLAAGDPAEGLELATAHRGVIHLLLTDMIMPVMNGRELYRQLVVVRPDLKVLYMSGYTDNVILHHHVSDEKIAFLQKPFSIHDLLQKVRTVLK